MYSEGTPEILAGIEVRYGKVALTRQDSTNVTTEK